MISATKLWSALRDATTSQRIQYDCCARIVSSVSSRWGYSNAKRSPSPWDKWVSTSRMSLSFQRKVSYPSPFSQSSVVRCVISSEDVRKDQTVDRVRVCSDLVLWSHSKPSDDASWHASKVTLRVLQHPLRRDRRSCYPPQLLWHHLPFASAFDRTLLPHRVKVLENLLSDDATERFWNTLDKYNSFTLIPSEFFLLSLCSSSPSTFLGGNTRNSLQVGNACISNERAISSQSSQSIFKCDEWGRCLGRKFVIHGCHCLARSAPRCKEIDHHESTLVDVSHICCLICYGGLKDLRQVLKTCPHEWARWVFCRLTENVFTSFERDTIVSSLISRVSLLATKVTDLGFHPIARFVFRNWVLTKRQSECGMRWWWRISNDFHISVPVFERVKYSS